MKIHPSNNYVLVEPKEAQDVTKSGIYIPKPTDEVPQMGKVIEVGKSEDDKLPPCKIGDSVVFKKYSTNELKVEDKTFFLIEFKEILAITEETK